MNNEQTLIQTDFMESRFSLWEESISSYFYRIARWIWHYCIPEKTPRHFSRGGIRYMLDRYDVVSRDLMVKGYWEPENITYLFNAARLNRCDIFLDIGANFGLYSLCAAKTGGFSAIHSFEPHPCYAI